MGLDSILNRISHIQQKIRDFKPQGLKQFAEQGRFQRILQTKQPPPEPQKALPVQEFKSSVSLDQSPRSQIDTWISKASKKYSVPESLIRSVIRIESNFDPKAVSKAGAQGLMQLMPNTAKALGVRDSFNIQQNIFGGVQYLKGLLNRFDGDLKLSLASYNAGVGRVLRAGGIPQIKETKEYVRKVLAQYQKLSGDLGRLQDKRQDKRKEGLQG